MVINNHLDLPLNYFNISGTQIVKLLPNHLKKTYLTNRQDAKDAKKKGVAEQEYELTFFELIKHQFFAPLRLCVVLSYRDSQRQKKIGNLVAVRG
ncbi:MAG: hypothetical protein DSM106950_10980 [Stigonema ocellatum SAG 48.90 = DSM 106950]|nr:hypothetical protein [Stigonema ocellatum SAG 48.90 = DSM 106950]